VTRQALELVQAPVTASLREVLEVVDRSAMAVALLVDRDAVLAGLLTDGDVRRALLRGAALDDAALPFATTTPQTVRAGSTRAHVLDLMRALRINAVPELDDEGHVVGLHTLSDVVGAQPLPNAAVVMAGGRGTRLGELTRTVPKPLMQVAGRSILEWVVLTLVGGGIRDVYVSVNHLATQIEEHLGDGARLGCAVRYLREEPERPLGTAGSLGLLRVERPELSTPVVVMNGDLMVQFEPAQLLWAHERSGATVTVATRVYQHEIPFGVVDTGEEGRVLRIREKPTMSLDVSAGIYAVSPSALDALEPGTFATMPGLVETLLERGEPVSAWPLSSDWIDVGTPADLARAKGEL
jgi:dTDP-glucose pyrophosphorylase